MLFTTSGKALNGLTYGKQGDEMKEQWHLWDKEPVSVGVVCAPLELTPKSCGS